jgi:hypothetical protein
MSGADFDERRLASPAFGSVASKTAGASQQRAFVNPQAARYLSSI